MNAWLWAANPLRKWTGVPGRPDLNQFDALDQYLGLGLRPNEVVGCIGQRRIFEHKLMSVMLPTSGSAVAELLLLAG
jgi:hypothetical protein